MPRTIDVKTRVSAVKDYVTSGESLRVVSERHGISMETLRRFVGDKIRKSGKGRPVTKGSMGKPFPGLNKRSGKDTSKPNANRRWTKTDDELLRDAVFGNFTVEETMDLLGRTKAGITTRKHVLLENGFIDEKRFKTPEGITRTRRPQNQMELFPGAEAVSVPVSQEEPMSAPSVSVPSISVESPSLRELAGLVQEFGVSIDMTVTANGTVIKMHN